MKNTKDFALLLIHRSNHALLHLKSDDFGGKGEKRI